MNKKSSIINTAIHVGFVGGWKWGRIDRYLNKSNEKITNESGFEKWEEKF